MACIIFESHIMVGPHKFQLDTGTLNSVFQTFKGSFGPLAYGPHPGGGGGGALEWQEGVSGSSMDSQKAP